MRRFAIIVFLAPLVAADDYGVAPRRDSSDYPAHKTEKSFSIGATVLSREQVKKIFSGDINSKYAVVEVAVYPEGHSVEVDIWDFALQVGENALIHPDGPNEVAMPWPERKNPLPGGTNVTSETGVVCGAGGGTYPSGGPNGTNTGNNPANYPRSRGCGTYEGVGVNNYPTAGPAPSTPSGPRAAVDAKIQNRALPRGRTDKTVAGYLYFQVSSKQRKGAALTLEYSKDDVSVDLSLPAPK